MNINNLSPYFDHLLNNLLEVKFLVTALCLTAYFLYYRKYRRYIYHQTQDVTKGAKPRGKCLPFFANGWYRLLNSDELKTNDVKYINYCGRDVVVFRGSNNKVYVLDAYCSHMGANLGIGGKVKNQCIQCPFHGWVFDGETGNCVQTADSLAKKHVTQYEYHDTNLVKKLENTYLKKCYEGELKLKKYLVREYHGSIMVWYDSREQHQEKTLFEPFNLDSGLEYRGESINYVNCHMQEIPENGADIRHFDFLHTTVFDNISFIRFQWSMQSIRANDPNLCTLTKHRFETINNYKQKIMKKYLKEEYKNYVNVINLECNLVIFKWKFFFFNATGFQVGPSLVYLFLKSFFFETTLAQSVTPLEKFHQRVSHKIFTNWYIPYWLSAYMLYGEVRQLFADMAIWNNKIFGSKLGYNLKTEADKNLLEWRNWFSQFYEGCHEFEKKKGLLEW
jgi:cholesterol 7-dehydrogenase